MMSINLDYSIALAPSDLVQAWVDEPTVMLRWNNGILEQMHVRYGSNAYGQRIERSEDWRPIPETVALSSSQGRAVE